MLSVIIITKNAGDTLKRCLESVHFANEIIIIDSGSTDSTIDIAKQFTQKVYSYCDWQGYGIQKNRALAFATGNWILNLDADECLDDKLQQEIIIALKAQKYDAYKIPIRMSFYGKKLKYSSSPSRHIRLFKRKDANFSQDIVHEKILLPKATKISALKHPIWHDSFKDLNHALFKMNRYSSYSAKIRKLEKNSPPSILHSLFSSIWMFLRCFILQRGFLDGKEGFVLACLNAQGAFYRHLKQIYIDKNLDNLPEV